MHSSISSSEVAAGIGPQETLGRARRPVEIRLIVIVLFIAVATVIALEIGTRLILTHFSNIERRVATEYRTVSRIRPAPGRPSLLLLGNSLLLEGVDMSVLRSLLPEHLRTYRYVIEATYLLDWKYG